MPIKVQGKYRTPKRQGQERNSPEYIIIKILTIQNKESIFKAPREKDKVTYKGKPIRIISNFSVVKSRRAWTETLPTLRDPNVYTQKNYQS